MLIVFVSIAVLGVTVFIVQRLQGVASERNRIASLYCAQAGMHNVIYAFRYNDTISNGNFSTGQTAIDANNSFVIGPNSTEGRDAYLLVVDSNATYQPANERSLLDLRVQDAARSRNIRLAFMNLSWSGSPNNRRLRTITIGDTEVWSGNVGSPVDADISDFTLDKDSTIYPVNVTFNSQVTLTAFNATFGMNDTSRTDAYKVYPASNNNTFFTFESTGRSGNAWRTIIARYNAATGNVSVMRENQTVQVFP
ncbi:MAG: hypothetical protein ABH865_05325 [Candidatus Omnitrophota bacterium]|nr:hypothetical protein [Candidatus Omnitrophota bacterium]